MTQPIHAAVDDTGQRIYFNDKKKKFFSVTRLLSETLPKQMFLVPWAAKVVAECAVELMMDLWDLGTGVYETEPLPNWLLRATYQNDEDIEWELIEKDLKQAWKWQRDDAGELGDEVHNAADEMLKVSKGKPHIFDALMMSHWTMILEGQGTISKSAFQRLQHLQKFLHKHNVVVVETEFTVFNEALGYAGSCDLAAYVDGVPHIIDIKTSRDVHDETALQITAYARGEYVLTDDGVRDTMPFSDDIDDDERHLIRGGILHLTPKACLFIEVDTTDEMYDCLNALCLVKSLWVDNGRKEALCEVLYDSSKEEK